jgi:1-deoxy-D-xylulose-5-phosphate reductoisomerase
MPKKKLVILGSTGSIGRNTLKIVEAHPGRFKVIALAAGANIRLLSSQIKRHSPVAVAVGNESVAEKLEARLVGTSPAIAHGIYGISALAALPGADLVVQGMVGRIALEPTYSAIIHGNDIAMANKEAIVMAGSIIMKRARKKGVEIIPVDSEHSAVFQLLQGHNKDEVRRIILSASGGPFLRLDRKRLSRVTPEQAMKHPTWKMGKKISVDSATLMNKALEVIEAHHLFGIPPERIDIVVHPQSAVHALVEFNDGSIIAHLGVPDMRIPIGYALAYPDRLDRAPGRLELKQVKALTFEPADRSRFPAIDLGYQALKAGGTMPSVLNAANEVAVEAFLNRELAFDKIIKVVKKTMQKHGPKKVSTIDDALEADVWAREKARELI